MTPGTRPVSVALVGAGAMGELVARRVYAGAGPGVRLTAVIDSRAPRRDALARELGADAHPSLAAALDAGTPIDAVDIRVPHDAHAEVAADAISRGLHILVEKPLATSAAAADQMIAAVHERGVVAAVAENYPHLRAVRAAVDAIAAGEIGSVRTLRTTRPYTLDGIWVRDGWRTAGASSGILLDQGTHHTSVLRLLGGEIQSVSAVASEGEQGSTGTAQTVLVTSRFDSGLAAQSLYSWGAAPLQDEAEGMVFGSTGRIEIRVAYEQAVGAAVRIGPAGDTVVALSPGENYYDSHRAIIEDWVACIRDGGRPVVTLEDGRADLAVVLAAARSLADGGRPVAVDHADRRTAIR